MLKLHKTLMATEIKPQKKASFKDLMSQMKEETKQTGAPAPVLQIPTPPGTEQHPQTQQISLENKKKLAKHYELNQGWYDALLNTDAVLNASAEAEKLKLDPDAERQILEIGVYEGASTVFWSDFYLNHPNSRLISIDPFTGSSEHHEKPENYPELPRIELIARGNIAKSKNAAKIDVIKGLSWDIFPMLNQRHGGERWIDVLYIDGAHESLAVARDVILYVPMVKEGGLVIFDDYAHPDVRRGVDMALNSFAEAEFGMFTGWQLAVKIK